MAGVVDDPAGQRQCEERVRQGQVEQVDGGGVELLPPPPDDVEHQAVAACADDKHGRVEDGEEDHGGPLVHKQVAGTLVERDVRLLQGDVHRSHPDACHVQGWVK